jgi:hypothetical protein
VQPGTIKTLKLSMQRLLVSINRAMALRESSLRERDLVLLS